MGEPGRPNPLPSTLGRFELLSALGSGGMATVYLARTRGTAGFERLFAVKCCHPHLRREPDFAAMFLDEARLAARIHHPNVVATLDVGEADDALYLVMEYVEGERLAEVWRQAYKRGQCVPEPVAVRILIDALTGLHAAHELRAADGRPLGLVHRDVSPQNVMVGVDGVARVMDFGVAKAEERAVVTRSGEVKGKVGYMAPEQLEGRGVDRRADVFAAGVVLWELLANQRLFQGESQGELLRRVMAADVPDLARVRPALPPALAATVMRALAREREARFATAAEFAEALEQCGLAAARPREVAAYIEAAFADAISTRRRLMAAAPSGAPPAAGQPVHEALGDEAATTQTVGVLVATEPSIPSRERPVPSAAGTAWRRTALAVFVAVLGVGGAFWAGTQRASRSRAEAAPGPGARSVVVVAATRPPAEQVPPEPRAAPTSFVARAADASAPAAAPLAPVATTGARPPAPARAPARATRARPGNARPRRAPAPSAAPRPYSPESVL